MLTFLPWGCLSPQSIPGWRTLRQQHPREALISQVLYTPIQIQYNVETQFI